jgi:diadenosine tetraphosphate (Ap4A) HIT family hydrolase
VAERPRPSTSLPYGGEYREISTFCAEIERRDPHNLVRDLLGEDVGESYLLEETESFVVMPGVGSLVRGYVMIVPRDHVLSFGHLPPALGPELEGLLGRVEEWQARTYSLPTIVFEHGPATFTERGGSCTDHAHLHVVPVPEDVDLVPVMRRDFDVRRVDGLLPGATEHIRAGRGPYLYLRHHDGRSYLCDAPKAKAQHLRRELASQLGIGDQWDWSLFPGDDHMVATIRDFHRGD